MRARKKKSPKGVLILAFVLVLAAGGFALSSKYLKVGVFSSTDQESVDNYKKTSELSIFLDTKDKIVFFSSSWCGPCSSIRGKLTQAAKNYPFLNIYEVSIEESNEVSDLYEVKMVPTVVFEKDGIKEVVSEFNLTKIDELINLATI